MKKPLRAAFVVTLSALAMGTEARSDSPPIHRNPPPRPGTLPDGGSTSPYGKSVVSPDVPEADVTEPVHTNPPKPPRVVPSNPPPRQPIEPGWEPHGPPPSASKKPGDTPVRAINANPPRTQPNPRMMELPDAGPPTEPVRTSVNPPARDPMGPMQQPLPAGTPDLPQPETKPSVVPQSHVHRNPPPRPLPGPPVHFNPPPSYLLPDGGPSSNLLQDADKE